MVGPALCSGERKLLGLESVSVGWYNNNEPGSGLKVVPTQMTIWLRISRTLVVTLVLLVLAAQGMLLAASIDSELGDKEVKMGEEAVVEVRKEYKLSDNAADLKHVREIGEKLAAVANKKEVDALYGTSKITPFQFSFDIIEDDDVNAFCVPGGKIFVYRGLLNSVQSDHELAGVLAHEITHAAHHHMVFLLKKQAQMSNPMALAMLAIMISGAKSSDIGNLYLGLQLYQIAKLNGYGMEAERDSDKGAIQYMIDAGYNPVGMLTFMERLARKTELIDLGIYRSHPLDADRVKAAMTELQKLGIKINRRATTNSISAVVKSEGVPTPEVDIRDKAIFKPAPADGKTALERAQEIADAINKALDDGLQMHEIYVDDTGGVLVLKNKPIVVVSDEEAKLMAETPGKIVKDAGEAIKYIVWKQMVDTMH